jgi:predicted ATPase/DNA-binding SARP family transcriptional activator
VGSPRTGNRTTDQGPQASHSPQPGTHEVGGAGGGPTARPTEVGRDLSSALGPDSPLTLCLFGAFEARLGGVPLPHLRRRKGDWLLALLVLRHGREVERSWLAGTLWPDCLEHQGANSLRVSLTNLRRSLGPEAARLCSPTPQTLALDLTGAEVDVITFDAAIAQGDAAPLEQAVTLYRGPLLEGCTEPWAFEERQAREQALLTALETLAARARAADDPATAVSHLRRAVAADPLRETAQRALMQALAAGGSYAAALEAYRELRLLLHREINAEPDPETRRLFEQIRAEARSRAATARSAASRPLPHLAPPVPASMLPEAPGRPEAGARLPRQRQRREPRGRTPLPPRSVRDPLTGLSPLELRPAPRHDLPLPLTRFIGREPQIAEVQQLLDQHRLVTLTGAGGCGKTRLALETARKWVETFTDGVWLVELAPLADPALVPRTVAHALHVREQPDSPLLATLTEALKGRQLLLVLDNCEHLVEACAHLALALLQACPHLRILATSREALGVPGEVPYRVPSLSVPGVQVFRRSGVQEGRSEPPEHLNTRTPEHLLEYEAVQLFHARASLLQPQFEVIAANAAAVALVCQRLDGIPLAIELAAALVDALPVEQIAARLDDRFRLLTGGSRTALPRQQTLRASIDWSYELLSEREQKLLRRLSIFAGGWTLEAAESICDDLGLFPAANPIHNPDVLTLLTALASKSLVVYQEYEGEPRYRLLETVREYARERLQESSEEASMRRRHADWFLGLVERPKRQEGSGQHAARLQQLEREHENLNAALDWLVASGDGERGHRMGTALWSFWLVQWHAKEGYQRVLQLLELNPEPTARRAELLWEAGFLALYAVGEAGAQPLLEESLAIHRALGDKERSSSVLGHLIYIAIQQGDYETVRRRCDEDLAIRRELDDPLAIKGMHWGLADVAMAQGDFATARSIYEQMLNREREAGDQDGIGMALEHVGDVTHAQGEAEAARRFFEECVAARRASELSSLRGAGDGISIALYKLGYVLCDLGEVSEARAVLEQSLVLRRRLGEHTGYIPRVLEGFARLAAAEGQAERAARLFGAREAHREAHEGRRTPSQQAEWERRVAAVREQLGEAAFAAAWVAGRALLLEQALACAQQESELLVSEGG